MKNNNADISTNDSTDYYGTTKKGQLQDQDYLCKQQRSRCKKQVSRSSSCVPDKPLDGPIALNIIWGFPAGKHKNGEPCTNKPDLDNANKMLQDVMQELGFFKDDKNIVQLNLSKIWTWHPGVMIEIKKVGEYE